MIGGIIININVKFLLFSVIPLEVAICFYPLWRFMPEETRVLIAILTMLMNFIVTPIFLLFVTSTFGIAYKVSLLLCIPICFFVNAATILIQYWNWGSSSGLLKSPDSTTIMIFQIELFVSMIMLIIGLIIISVVKLQTK